MLCTTISKTILFVLVLCCRCRLSNYLRSNVCQNRWRRQGFGLGGRGKGHIDIFWLKCHFSAYFCANFTTGPKRNRGRLALPVAAPKVGTNAECRVNKIITPNQWGLRNPTTWSPAATATDSTFILHYQIRPHWNILGSWVLFMPPLRETPQFKIWQN